ncbi:unnamed protein product [Effrenium voratum]|nr:unnamed protein product [Effrenium voratum]
MQRELETSTEVRLCICNPPNAFCMKRALEACEGGPIASWQVVKDPLSGTSPGPELECNITVVITTSPVPSNPSTELLERVLLSLHRIPGLRAAPKLIACDGHRRSAGKANHKAGKVTPEESENYQRFIAQLQTSQCSAESTSPYFKCRVLALEEHQGFGFAVKSALEEVGTEFVLVVQHDQEFIAAFNLPQVLSAMTQHEELKYVGLSSVSTLNYDNMVRSKFGVAISQTLEFGIPLMPLIFFYDKPHICRTAHYRDLLGPGSLVRKGEFIEETLGVAQREDIIKHGMDAHAKYGTFQLDFRDEYGGQFAVVRHLNGRAFLSPEQRVARGWTATLRFAA